MVLTIPLLYLIQVAHIPGAIFFDIDQISDPTSNVRHLSVFLYIQVLLLVNWIFSYLWCLKELDLSSG